MQKECRKINFAVDEKTFENLMKQVKLSKVSTTKAQYLRNLINSRAKNKDLKKIAQYLELGAEIILDMQGIANNINQIAHQLNSNDYYKFDEYKFYEKTDTLLHEVQIIITELKEQNSLLKGYL
jgi:thymidine kinase